MVGLQGDIEEGVVKPGVLALEFGGDLSEIVQSDPVAFREDVVGNLGFASSTGNRPVGIYRSELPVESFQRFFQNVLGLRARVHVKKQANLRIRKIQFNDFVPEVVGDHAFQNFLAREFNDFSREFVFYFRKKYFHLYIVIFNCLGGDCQAL